ncbi:branched-chain amino acid ABC transporter permease [Kaistia nematophila]|uniref:Branched-chain amino acid ABC transporter permease n=1 Tax=Kaistia nematophila TaxID=2994654 RepID=A0A9X3ILG8_9HYPH|nr:branched-chain amino acid ABC transporter permease [Kaistia nematophila]MCX5570664.1 branched-chain amino acid ABC transporter permease [Kaistia nematophila]
MVSLFGLALDALNYVSVLLLVCVGLVVIFGLMQVINLAHGEFFLLGAYTVLVAQGFGVPFWLAVPIAFVAVGLVGLLCDAAILRFIYDRPVDTILATWGLSLAIRQAIVIVFGPQSQQVAAPLTEPVQLFGVAYSSYRLVVILIAMLVALAVFLVLYRTSVGLAARAAMANRQMAQCLGINMRRLDRATFSVGAGLAGLAGAVMAPLMSVDPQMGMGFVLPAFLSILVGGVGSPAGAIWGSIVIGSSTTLVSAWWTPVIAQIVVFLLAIVAIRFLPTGLSGLRRK